MGEVIYLTRKNGKLVRPDSDVDALVMNHGTLFLVHLHSERARIWAVDHVQDGATYFGGNLVVEPRYIRDLLEGMIQDGLKVQ